mgnify:CR=1 FL=1
MPTLNNNVQAVRFGENTDCGIVDQNKKFNYIFSLIHREDSITDAPYTGTIGGYTISIAAGQLVHRMFSMDDDYNFLLWNCQFCAMYKRPGNGYIKDSFENTVYTNTKTLETSDLQTVKGTPYERYLRISMSIHSPTGKYLYGGPDFSYNKAGSMSPMYVLTLQGDSNGYGQLKTSYLVPKNGVIHLEITNIHPTKTLEVAGYLYGEKVRV